MNDSREINIIVARLTPIADWLERFGRRQLKGADHAARTATPRKIVSDVEATPAKTSVSAK